MRFSAPRVRLYAIGGKTLSDGALAGLREIDAYTPASYAQLTASASAGANVPFSVTMTIRNDAGNVDTSYRGAVSFSSRDAGATLPANYTFVAGDSGAHTFFGVKLAAGGVNETLTATTDQLGNASFLTRTSGPGIYTLTVLNVTADYVYYAPAANVMTSRSLVLGAR